MQDAIRKEYGSDAVDVLTKVFDAYVLDTQKPIRSRNETRPGFEDSMIHDFYTDTEYGELYFEFVLRCEDTDDPLIVIVSVHKPSFRSKL